MIRHLAAVQYDIRDTREAETGIQAVRWRQWKRANDTSHDGSISHRMTLHRDPVASRMVYTEDGRRVRQERTEPRYPEDLRAAVYADAEAMRQRIARATGLDVVKWGYAPGSPNVDVWYRDESAVRLAVTQNAALHRAAHAFAKRVAATLEDPGQPVSIWARCTDRPKRPKPLTRQRLPKNEAKTRLK